MSRVLLCYNQIATTASCCCRSGSRSGDGRLRSGRSSLHRPLQNHNLRLQKIDFECLCIRNLPEINDTRTDTLNLDTEGIAILVIQTAEVKHRGHSGLL